MGIVGANCIIMSVPYTPPANVAFWLPSNRTVSTPAFEIAKILAPGCHIPVSGSVASVTAGSAAVPGASISIMPLDVINNRSKFPAALSKV
jgi:hypothetical protein